MKIVNLKKHWALIGLFVVTSVKTPVMTSVVTLVTLVASVALAQNDDSDDARTASEKAKRRKYPGGNDEQELTVQPTLPQTSRYPEAPKAAVAPAPAGSEPESND